MASFTTCLHSSHVHAVVVLKIASDVPEALDPLEIKHSQELVVPTLQERALAELLMVPFCIHHHHRSQASGFFVKLTLNCSRCQENFTIVTWLGQSLMPDKREMSQDEGRFMQNAEEIAIIKSAY